MTMVCPGCRVYCREGRSDGHNSYTVCAYCGRSELIMHEAKALILEGNVCAACAGVHHTLFNGLCGECSHIRAVQTVVEVS